MSKGSVKQSLQDFAEKQDFAKKFASYLMKEGEGMYDALKSAISKYYSALSDKRLEQLRSHCYCFCIVAADFLLSQKYGDDQANRHGVEEYVVYQFEHLAHLPHDWASYLEEFLKRYRGKMSLSEAGVIFLTSLSFQLGIEDRINDPGFAREFANPIVSFTISIWDQLDSMLAPGE
jgi:hypothetical protein